MNTARQQGMTLIGFILVMILVVIVAYVGMQVVPMYTEWHSVKQAMEKVSNDDSLPRGNVRAYQQALNKYFNTGYVETVDGEDAQFARSRSGITMTMKYQRKAHMVGNLSLVADFEHSVTL